MNTAQTPLRIDYITDNLYAGFWRRLGALLLDVLCVIPFTGIIIYFNNLAITNHYFTVIPGLLFGLWYHVYLVKEYGGTPGKLIVGIKVININGKNVAWKEAIMRYIVLFVISLFAIFVMFRSIGIIDVAYYESLSWIEKSKYIAEISPVLFTMQIWLNNIWIYSEFIVLLTNKRKRAIHDYIAETVIIKNKYHDDILLFMEKQDSHS